MYRTTGYKETVSFFWGSYATLLFCTPFPFFFFFLFGILLKENGVLFNQLNIDDAPLHSYWNRISAFICYSYVPSWDNTHVQSVDTNSDVRSVLCVCLSFQHKKSTFFFFVFFSSFFFFFIVLHFFPAINWTRKRKKVPINIAQSAFIVIYIGPVLFYLCFLKILLLYCHINIVLFTHISLEIIIITNKKKRNGL